MTEKPEDHLKVSIAGEEQDLLMTFGLLNRLLKCVGNETEALTAGFSSDLREKMIAEALNKRGKSGVFEKFTADKVDDLDMDADEASRLMTWISEHILHFFILAAEGIQKTEKRFANRTAALSPQPQTGTPA